MYMGPIVAAKPTSSPALRRVTGAAVLPVAAVVMLPWLAVHGLVAAGALAVRAIPAAPRTLMSAIDYAGTVALGR